VAALGFAQIISWGTLFYTIAVLGPALREATGVGEVPLYTSYSIGLVVSGLMAPAIGRRIDARGGRRVLSAGSLIGAIACGALALVQGPVTLLIAWVLAGVAMAATLYDPAFATLHDVAGSRYRRSVTALTLFGGFASTVFWPLSQFLLDTLGVRTTFAIYAALHMMVCLPLHWRFLPRDRSPACVRHASAPDVPLKTPRADRAFFWLATALTLASIIASCIAAHLIGLLTASGLTAREAVLVGALIGPTQVAGRVMEFMLGRHVGPIAAGTLSFATLAAALAIFAVQSGNFALAVLFALLFGWSNGVLTIVRGTVPAELFGREGYGALLGRLAMPQMIARALAPAALAGLLVVDAQRFVTLSTLVACGALAFVAYRLAVRRRGIA
jgi:predicted MFS family arabinose efflux permease